MKKLKAKFQFWWNKKSKEEKRVWIINKSIALGILLIGIIASIVCIYASGWSISAMVQNPTFLLIVLLLLLGGLTFLITSPIGRKKK